MERLDATAFAATETASFSSAKKHWAIDKFHASRGHKKDWPCNPNRVAALKRRLKKMNISICEQTFSCFPHYARVINEMKPTRHRILVLYYSKLHNE